MRITKILNLTVMQKGLLFNSISNQSDEYLEQVLIEFVGNVDLKYLTESIEILCSEYDILHALFAYSKVEEPKLIVVDNLKPQIEMTAINDDDSVLDKYLKADRDRLFHLEKGPLIRFALLFNNEITYMIITFHHILLDGWSLSVIMDRLLSLYSQYSQKLIPQTQKDIFLEQYLNFLDSYDYHDAKIYCCRGHCIKI